MAAHAGDGSAFCSAAIDRRKFAEFIFVADFEGDALAFISEILRIAADDRKRVDPIFFAQAGGALHDGMMIEAAAIAEFDFIADDGVGANGYTLTQFRGG